MAFVTVSAALYCTDSILFENDVLDGRHVQNAGARCTSSRC